MSNSKYIEYIFKTQPLQPTCDILIAELAELGFESFVEEAFGIRAYILKSQWDPLILGDVFILDSKDFEITYTFEAIENINWNEVWEKNFNPIQVDNTVTVRASFHDTPTTPLDIIIDPKMSFGTGHHETTHMMIQHILKTNFENKAVLDMGCGTGVLAILAEKCGAKTIDAIDIDHWCYVNSLENVERNHCINISVFEGDVALLKDKNYDVILANINRNILIADISKYAKTLNKNGMLFLSGFYKSDISNIEATCRASMLKLDEIIEKGNWVSLKFVL